MLVSDAVGVAFFAAIICWNYFSEFGTPEITVLCSLAILCTLVFEFFYPHMSEKCTQHPWRDLAALLQHEFMLLYLLNWAITLHIARNTLVHLTVLEHIGGYVNHAAVLYNRNRMDIAQRDARRLLVREDLGMSYWNYVIMLNIVTIPHNVLRYHVRWMVLRLANPTTGPAAAAIAVDWRLSLQWCVLYCVLFAVYQKTPLPLWLAKVDCRWYQHWHQWFHEDPLLYRAVHKFHHLFKRPTPLVSSTETHMEWCLSWAACHTFCNPFYQLNLFFYDAVDAIEMHSHDVLSDKPVIGGPEGYHLIHHKLALCNFSVPDWDKYYGTMTNEKHFDDYFPHRVSAKAKGSCLGDHQKERIA